MGNPIMESGEHQYLFSSPVSQRRSRSFPAPIGEYTLQFFKLEAVHWRAAAAQCPVQLCSQRQLT